MADKIKTKKQFPIFTVVICSSAAILVALKLASIVAWSWWWVLTPIWATAALVFLLLFIAVGVGLGTAIGPELLKEESQEATPEISDPPKD